MQRGGGGRDDFFGLGDPFGGSGGPFDGSGGPFGGSGGLFGGSGGPFGGSGGPFGGSGGPFGGFGSPFGGFGGPGGMMSSFFGGRNPFDDPFFTQPFGGMMGPSMFGQSIFGSDRSFFGQPNNGGFIEHQQPPHARSRGPIIEELPSDGEETEEGGKSDAEKKDNPRKHSRSSKGPYVEDPEEEAEENFAEKKSKHIQYSNDFNRAGTVMPQTRSYSFHSSTVTYGGPDGAFRTSSKTRRSADGVTVEESKEADTTTRRASHRISRGFRDKGHSLTRELNSDGRVETMQTLHNLNEDELPRFEKEWKGNARQHLPGWDKVLDSNSNGANSRRGEQPARGWALPSTEQPHDSRTRAQPRPNSYPCQD